MLTLEKSVLSVSAKERGNARKTIINKAVNSARAETEEAKKKVVRIISDTIDITKNYFKQNLPKEASLLAAEIVDSFEDTIETTMAPLQETLDKIGDKVDKIQRNNKNGLSLDSLIYEARKSNYSNIEDNLQTAFKAISTQHPLFPDFGFDFYNGHLASVPLTEYATTKYPEKWLFKGPIKHENYYFSDPSIDPLKYAYMHQIVLTMELSEAKRFLGDFEDPIQTDSESIEGHVLRITPPKLSPRIPCSVLVDEKTYFEYLLLRTQEILEDGTIIVSNSDQENSHIILEIRFNISKNAQKKEDSQIVNGLVFNIKLRNATNEELLLYDKFIKAINRKQFLQIHDLNSSKDIISGAINEINGHDYSTLEEEIDFLERVCEIENYFNLKIILEDTVKAKDIESVNLISDLIRNNSVIGKWEKATVSCPINQELINSLEQCGEKGSISFRDTISIKICGQVLHISVWRTCVEAIIKDYSKLIEIVRNESDKNEISIELYAGENNTVLTILYEDEIGGMD